MTDITVVIPFFNSERTISDTLNSLLNQDINNFNIVLLNNNSSDLSPSICREFSSRNKSISTTIENRIENIGSFYNIYNAITYKQSGYTALLADDMKIEKSYLRDLITTSKLTDSILSYSGVILHHGENVLLHADNYFINDISPLTRCCNLISHLTLGTAIYGLYDSRQMSRVRRFWESVDCIRLSDLQLLLSICAVGKVEQIKKHLIHRRLVDPTTNEQYEERLRRAFNDRHTSNKLMFISAIRSIYNAMIHYFDIQQSIYLASLVLKRFSQNVLFELSNVSAIINNASINQIEKVSLMGDVLFITSLMDDKIGLDYIVNIKRMIGLD